jgi:hypothetical protein
MKKLFVPFFLFCFIVLLIFFNSCSKSSPTNPQPTNTPTPTYTATETPTQYPQTNFYNFETNTESWNAGSPLFSMDDFGISVAHNTNPIYCYNGSAGSLQLNTDFTKSLNLFAIASFSFSTEQNLEYHTITAKFYAPAGIVTTTNPLTVSLYVFLSTKGYSYWGELKPLTTEGWYDLVLVIQESPIGGDYFQHISEIGIVIMKNTSSSVNYVGPVYIDEVAW